MSELLKVIEEITNSGKTVTFGKWSDKGGLTVKVSIWKNGVHDGCGNSISYEKMKNSINPEKEVIEILKTSDAIINGKPQFIKQ